MVKSKLFLSLALFVSSSVSAGSISYGTSVAFDDGLTDQLDRLNSGAIYERLSKTGSATREDFWGECDAAGIFGTTASCALNAPSYTSSAHIGIFGGWNLLGLNLTQNLAGIQEEVFQAHTESSGRGNGQSSMNGSFQLGFSDEIVNDIISGNDQGVRLAYGFSWIGFGILDDFGGVAGQWISSAAPDSWELLPGRSINSSFRTRITAYSSDHSLQLVEPPKVIFEETLTSAGERKMAFPPDVANYGFAEGDIVTFRADFEQRLWTERVSVSVSEPYTTALLFVGFLGLAASRIFKKGQTEISTTSTLAYEPGL